jgi:hypothetical protein
MRGILKLTVAVVLLAAGAKTFAQSTAFMVDGHIQVRSAPNCAAISSGVLNPRHFIGRLLIADST